MYLNHFRLKSKPFAMNPDPAFLYESSQHAAALTMLEYAMESQAPFCLFTGEIGSGKTTLIHRLLRTLGKQVTVGLVSNTHRRFRSIHPWALSAFRIVDDDPSEIGQFEALNDFFIREYAKGRRSLLIIDEAQNLSVRTLEELRLLSNVNSEKDVALQIMLVGQPELRRKLERPELRQFAQRVAVDFHLNALTFPEAVAYVRHRLTVAGGDEDIFDREAIEIIHERSGGIPRVMNRLCDRSLVYAYAEGRRHVTARLVDDVLRDQMFGKSSEPVEQRMAPAETPAIETPAPETSPADVAPTRATPAQVADARAQAAAAAEAAEVAAAAAAAAALPAEVAATAAAAAVMPAQVPEAVLLQPKMDPLPLPARQPEATIDTPRPAQELRRPVRDQAKPTIRRLPLLAGRMEPTIDSAQPKPKRPRLPLNIGQIEPPKAAARQTESPAQPKKRRSTSMRSWFFFS